ncbi:uncharacterized protein LOC108656098 isoform X2 [Drosophila navojoa]|uniref:uncharacterized protein LOC108656098 isoform X2 n=1 Tax=Drosophila navojoa TaxID=7232 RepID=UPI0011BDD0BC|nr:uncharacterized protein LOC108656098 isoform X2 [Drosophila navojoa]
MALRLRRDVQKASYYVWFLGAEEAKGLRGARVINSVLPYLVDRSRGQEPLKVTLQVSHKGIKIVQGSSKHLIPHSAITSSVQTDDIVACVLLLYNPATKCPLHVHAYRCDSETTAEALHLQLQILINRPDNQKRFEELETRLGILPPLPAGGPLGHNGGSSSSSHSGGDKRHESGHKSSHHQSQQQLHSSGGYSQQQQQQRRHETSPKRFSSSLGSDTGNSTRESECSEEHGLTGSPVSRSPPHGGSSSTGKHHSSHHGSHHPHGHPPLTPQQNSDLFDSLAAELRAKLNGNGPPLLLPPRDYDTVHRSKGNLTAIELRRCRNALIVGGAGTPKGQVSPGAGPAAPVSAVPATTANGKQVSSRGSSGIGSDLAPSPERQELNSSSDDEHWSNEADNSVIALKPSQIALSHHAQLKRKSAVQPPEDSYLRDLPAKPYVPRQSERVKTPSAPSNSKSWSREDEIKPIIMRPADYDAKFNRVMQLEPQPAKHEAAPKLRDTDKYNEINRLLNKKLSGHDRDRLKERSLHDDDLDDFDDSDPCSDPPQKSLPVPSYRKENLTDKQKFMEYASKKQQQQQQQQQLKSYAAEEAQRYGGSRHRYVDPAELPFEQLPPVPAHNKYAAVHRGAEQTRSSNSVGGGSSSHINGSNPDRLRERHDRDRERDRERERERERERHQSQSRHQMRARSREYMQPTEPVPPVAKSSSSRLSHHAERYPSPAPTPNSGNSGSSSSGKPLASMPKGYRHSYAEPVFARSGGRVGLAAVNPY